MDLFASFKTTKNYNASSTVITAYITLKASLTFTHRMKVILPVSSLPWLMSEVLAPTDSSSIFCIAKSPRPGTLELEINLVVTL
jgi:hypothetical protein